MYFSYERMERLVVGCVLFGEIEIFFFVVVWIFWLVGDLVFFMWCVRVVGLLRGGGVVVLLVGWFGGVFCVEEFF